MSLMAAMIAGLLVACAPTGQAQDAKPAPKSEGKPAGPGGPGGPGGRGEAAKERVNRMAEELKLTDEQKTKVEAVFKEQQEKMRTARDPNSTPEDRRQKMQTMREEMSKKMRTSSRPSSSAERSAMNLWLAPWKPQRRIPASCHASGTA